MLIWPSGWQQEDVIRAREKYPLACMMVMRSMRVKKNERDVIALSRFVAWAFCCRSPLGPTQYIDW